MHAISTEDLSYRRRIDLLGSNIAIALMVREPILRPGAAPRTPVLERHVLTIRGNLSSRVRMQLPAFQRSQDLAVSLLRGGPWASLPAETVELLAAGGTLSNFPAGLTVYTEADEERVGVIVQGLLRVYMNTSDGREVTVRYVRRSGLLGAPALVGGPAPVCVQAVTDCAVYFMDATRVKNLARTDAAVAWVFAEESVHRLYDVLEELAGNTFATVRQRVVRHLLDLAASRPASDGRLVALVNQQDLANSVGSVREVVARVLHELRAASLVRTSPGHVEILDPLKMSVELWSRMA